MPLNIFFQYILSCIVFNKHSIRLIESNGQNLYNAQYTISLNLCCCWTFALSLAIHACKRTLYMRSPIFVEKCCVNWFIFFVLARRKKHFNTSCLWHFFAFHFQPDFIENYEKMHTKLLSSIFFAIFSNLFHVNEKYFRLKSPRKLFFFLVRKLLFAPKIRTLKSVVSPNNENERNTIHNGKYREKTKLNKFVKGKPHRRNDSLCLTAVSSSRTESFRVR